MNAILYRYVFFFAILFILIRCDEKGFQDATYPRIIALPVTDIGPEGVTFHAKTVQEGTAEVVNRGFVWGLDAGVTLLNGEKIEVGPGSGDFDAQAAFGLVKGETYYVRAFAATKDMLAYSPFVEFVSNGSIPAQIASISPTNGSVMDTIIIKGSRFSGIPGNNKVKFGDAVASVIKSSESTIKCIVPGDVGNKPVRVTLRVGTGETMSQEYFSLLAPVIESISPTQATFGSEVRIKGKYFGPALWFNVVEFGEHKAYLVSATSNELVVRVPSAIRTKESVITVSMGGFKVEAASRFTIDAPVITGLSVTKAKSRDLVTINGKNFNPDPGGNAVSVAGINATVVSSTGTSVVISVPDGAYSTRALFPEVTVAEQTVVSTHQLTLQNSWILKSWDVELARSRAREVAFSVNGIIYAGTGNYNSDKFRSYVPASNTWTEVAPFPGSDRWDAVAFSIGNYGYVGLGASGETDFWRYDPSANAWTRIADFPSASSRSVGLSANGKGYVAISANNDNLWEYNPSTNTWTKKANCPSISLTSHPAAGFVIGNDLYLYAHASDSPGQVHRYNVAANSWTEVASPAFTPGNYGETGYSIAGQGYIRSGYAELSYSPSGDSWDVNYNPALTGSRNYALSVVADSKVYFGGGYYENDWWEFDPSFE